MESDRIPYERNIIITENLIYDQLLLLCDATRPADS